MDVQAYNEDNLHILISPPWKRGPRGTLLLSQGGSSEGLTPSLCLFLHRGRKNNWAEPDINWAISWVLIDRLTLSKVMELGLDGFPH